jgi:hypothetical protein
VCGADEKFKRKRNMAGNVDVNERIILIWIL